MVRLCSQQQKEGRSLTCSFRLRFVFFFFFPGGRREEKEGRNVGGKEEGRQAGRKDVLEWLRHNQRS